MEFNHFSFIVRFRADAGTPESHRNALLAFFSPEEAAGCKLYYRYDDDCLLYPEPHYVFVLSDLSVKQARELTVAFRQEFPEKERCVFIKPFPQNNEFRDAPEFVSFGTVNPDGTVSDCPENGGRMRFTGDRELSEKTSPAVLFVPEAFALSRDKIHCFEKRFPDCLPVIYPDYCATKTPARWLALDNGASYSRTPGGFAYFRMYDDTILFDGTGEEAATEVISEAGNRGFKRLLCVTEDTHSFTPEGGVTVERVSRREVFHRYLECSRLADCLRDAETIACCSTDMQNLLGECSMKEAEVILL